MSEMICLHCGATTSNGLVLCELCQRKASTIFEFMPIYIRNLARWRPGHAGSRPVPGSRVLYDGAQPKTGTGDRISDAVDEAMTALMTWAKALSDDRGFGFARPLTLADAVISDDLPTDLAEQLGDDPAKAARWLCAGLEHHLVTIATLEWGGEMIRDFSGHEEVLRNLTEIAVPGWYAGACKRRVSMDNPCGAPTYVVPGLTWVKCQVCGATTYARDHLETIIEEAKDWIAKPKDLACAIVALLDEEESVPKLYDRIRQWEHREIKADRPGFGIRRLDEDGDPVGPKRYRMNDVLNMIAEEKRRVAEAAMMSA